MIVKSSVFLHYECQKHLQMLKNIFIVFDYGYFAEEYCNHFREGIQSLIVFEGRSFYRYLRNKAFEALEFYGQLFKQVKIV